MTYRELWEQLHPGEDFSMMLCPNDFDFGEGSRCIGNCKEHWNHEVYEPQIVPDGSTDATAWVIHGEPILRDGFLYINATCDSCGCVELLPYSFGHGMYHCTCGAEKKPGFKEEI